METEKLTGKIDLEVKEDAPLLVNQGNLINEGVNPDLDDLRKISFSGKDYLLQIQKREIERTGISSLKIAYNKVFGYFIEVSTRHGTISGYPLERQIHNLHLRRIELC